jgi:hypothetical protein
VIGAVVECGLPMILRNGAKCGSCWISDDFAEACVVGTFRIAFENWARKCGFVVRYLTSSHAWSSCLTPFGMPMIVPFTWPEP